MNVAFNQTGENKLDAAVIPVILIWIFLHNHYLQAFQDSIRIHQNR